MLELELLDIARIEDVTDHDRQLEIELASLYVTTAARYVGDMGRCLEGGQDWSAPAHSLKGASLNFGAPVVGELARAAEHRAPDHETLSQIRDAMTRTREAIVARTGGLLNG